MSWQWKKLVHLLEVKMNKKEKKISIFEPTHRLHFMDLATSPLGKRLSRAGYVDDKHLESMLYLYGFDLDYEWYEEHLDDDAIMRSDYTKDVYTGGSLFVGYLRKDFNIKNLHSFVYGDKVDLMYDLITGGNVVGN